MGNMICTVPQIDLCMASGKKCSTVRVEGEDVVPDCAEGYICRLDHVADGENQQVALSHGTCVPDGVNIDGLPLGVHTHQYLVKTAEAFKFGCAVGKSPYEDGEIFIRSHHFCKCSHMMVRCVVSHRLEQADGSIVNHTLPLPSFWYAEAKQQFEESEIDYDW
ncbi:PREDICTED: uncharacterized protein LOC106812346 isoform X1 [Priapulus caudatus]|uniref:Uncharacterized protein LOC106812346 isoform X1 n=1 Tax=Priapulus caudatus TaxID=37621 RepID=A0ABM1EHL0_PRICU|nr:PREDICTED: uncharacterized protein LOC106812346 isoform X1 [Priapulus caudatus]